MPAEIARRHPDPHALHPIPGIDRVAFVRNLRNLPPTIEVGEYTYYDDPEGPDAFLRNVLYHFEFIGDRLIIGRYCALAAGTRFIMNGGNHRTVGISTFPFTIFPEWRGLWEGELDFPSRGDTVVGNDVWIGYDTLIMPGVRIGDGAVVASRSVVTSEVPPYAIVGGNPARLIRQRWDDATIERLLAIRWWDWPVERVTEAIPLISQADVDALDRFAADRQQGAR
jgi:virginiamycin A acetyltransferase